MITSIMKRGMKVLIYSQTSMVHPLMFGIGQEISSSISLGMWLLTHAGIEVNHVSKRGFGCGRASYNHRKSVVRKNDILRIGMQGFFCVCAWQWETMLHYNIISHCLGTYAKMIYGNMWPETHLSLNLSKSFMGPIFQELLFGDNSLFTDYFQQ